MVSNLTFDLNRLGKTKNNAVIISQESITCHLLDPIVTATNECGSQLHQHINKDQEPKEASRDGPSVP